MQEWTTTNKALSKNSFICLANIKREIQICDIILKIFDLDLIVRVLRPSVKELLLPTTAYN
jgi:hypothetical protein